MKVALVQCSYLIGQLEANADRILRAVQEIERQGGEVAVFSELALTGYPPMDLLDNFKFVDQCAEVLVEMARQVPIPVLLGAPSREGQGIYNAYFRLQEEGVSELGRKVLLPNYDVFDESRYFLPGSSCSTTALGRYQAGIAVCEDLWAEDGHFPYPHNPLKALFEHAEFKPDLMLNPAASPYSMQGVHRRHKVLASVAERYGVPLLYVNQVGAMSDLIFDGSTSVWLPGQGQAAVCPAFEESYLIWDLEEQCVNHQGLLQVPSGSGSSIYPGVTSTEDRSVLGQVFNPEQVTKALIRGIRDYLWSTGGERVVVGLSGGVDSAVVTCLAVMALGADRVTALLMPSGYSSERSVTDSLALCALHGVSSQILPIEASFVAVKNTLAGAWEEPIASLTEENIQPRLRALLLMAYSNQYGDMWLNSSNKSEAAVGYSTLYGDMGGGLSVIGDLYKTQVYALAAAWNLHRLWIPHGILEAAPSAELKPNQLDSDSLPPYPVLDALLMDCIEGGMDQGALEAAGHQPALVQKVLGMLRKSEYKRYQMPPVLRVSSRSFGRGWRRSLV